MIRPDDSPRTNSAVALPTDDPRVVEALEAYLAALETGEGLDRQEFLARYPDIADELATCLRGLEFVRQAAPHLSQAGAEAGTADAIQSASQTPGALGDFRLIREIGRGGMGIVYEAEQISLGRRVALKVLPFAATMDSRQLQRFKNEAHAAAQLHHTNVVPVYSVGCERGVHFYAMQYIEGRSLAEVIADLRFRISDLKKGTNAVAKQPEAAIATTPHVPDPADQSEIENRKSQITTKPIAALSTIRSTHDKAYFRTVAELGIQAAEALDFAHERGVIHRDIKPANLLVDADARLWVTDFGLAQVQGDARMTMSGDLLGTLRYMSPEQALAKRVVVDHRTDIYSLGATLYELLTLEPAYRGNDRQELLRQISFEEPRPPRRLNKAIAPELETIVLRAMEKNPAERYATAQDLADDLRHFVMDEPIPARRPSWRQVATKWARRHKSFMYAVAACLVIALIALGIATVVVMRERDEAVRQRDLVREQRRFARQAVNDMYTDVAEKWLANSANLDDVQRQFLQKALRYYQEFVKEGEGDDPEERFETAKACRRIGKMLIMGYSDRKAEGRIALEQAIAILEGLWHDFPGETTYARELASSYQFYGFTCETDLQEDERAHQRCVAIWEQLADQSPNDPENRHRLAMALANLSNPVMRLRPHDGMLLLERSVRISAQVIRQHPGSDHFSVGYALATNNFAESLVVFGRWKEADEYFHQAIPAWQSASSAPASRIAYSQHMEAYRWHNLGKGYRDLANLLRRMKRFAGAEEAMREALRIHQQLVSDFPSSLDYRGALSEEQWSWGKLLMAMGRENEAEQACQRAIQSVEQNVTDYPNNHYLKCQLAGYLLVCPKFRFQDPRRAVKLAKVALELLPDAASWAILGEAFFRNGDPVAALPALEKSLQLLPSGNPTCCFLLAMTHWKLGNNHEARASFETAAQWMDVNAPYREDFLAIRAEAAALLGHEGAQIEVGLPPTMLSKP